MKPPVAVPGVLVLLVVVVCFAWIAVIFLPVPVDVRIGVQTAMMLVLGAYFGVQKFGRNKNGNEAAPTSEVTSNDRS